MWILGLTGAMGAGKSTLAKYFRLMGVPVHCADRAIHSLLRKDIDIQQKIKFLWPEVFFNGKIDRSLLGDRVLSSPSDLAQLEEILYPKLAKQQKEFLLKNQKHKAKFVVLDVPLLFEVGLDRYCHYVILASAPLFLRKLRVLSRKGMAFQKFQDFESHQLNDAQRRKRADFMIPCGREKGSALKRIREILYMLSQKSSPKWQGRWPTNFKREPYGQGNRFRHGNNRV